MSRRDPLSSPESMRLLIRRGELARVLREESEGMAERREPDELFALIDDAAAELPMDTEPTPSD